MRLGLPDATSPVLGLLPAWAILLFRAVRERTLWFALGLGAVALALAYQSPRSLLVDIGGPFDGPHTPGFHAPEQAGDANFRWSAGRSSLVFPGLGRPLTPLTVRLQLSSGRGPGSPPLEVQVTANGRVLPPMRLTPESAAYSLSIPPQWIGPGGDLRLDFAVPTFRVGSDQRDLGFTADFVRLELPGGPVLPSTTQLFWLLVGSLLLYVLLRMVWVVPRAAGVLVLALLLTCAGVIAVQRLLLTVFSLRLALALLLAIIFALSAEILLRWVTRLSGRRDALSVPEWSWAGLRALLALTVALKVGGLLYPHTFIIDAYFHLKQITYMAEGRPWEQFFGRNLALSVMPKDEWGTARAFIPYSPFFYVVAAPLERLALPAALTVPVVMGLFEAMKVGLVFLLGLALNAGRAAPRRALAAAAVFAVIPATFLLQQWGNWPTQLSLWLVTLWAALTCLFWQRLSPWGNASFWGVWLAGTAVLALALISYTVTALYTGVFAGLLVVAGLLFARRERARWLAIGLSLVVATVVALLVFYGQYIDDVLTETLPTFGQAVEEQGKLTTLRPSWDVFLSGTIARAMQSYNLAIIYALGLAGALWVLLRRGQSAQQAPSSPLGFANTLGRARSVAQSMSWSQVWLAAWLLTFPVFTLLDYYADQALKEFWYALPAVAVVSGAWLLLMQRRGLAGRLYRALAALLWALLIWQSLSLWVFRLLFHNR